MNGLKLTFLGEFSVARDGRALTGFRYDKVRGLLAWLALDAATTHRREALAGMLWPGLSPEVARGNLRYAVFNLRAVLGELADRLFKVTRHSLGFDASLVETFDHAEFFADLPKPGTDPNSLAALERQAALYRGPLLDGLILDDAPQLEHWLADRREEALRRALELHSRLADYYASTHRIDDALRHVRRQVALAPWQERDRRRMMELLASSDREAEALQEFDACTRYLRRELGVEPDLATQELAARIRQRASRSGRSAHSPTRPQRLPVTAMVCRLRLPAGADPDDAVEAFAAPRGEIADLIAARGGHFVALHAGLLAAYFGYPAVHELAPRRAAETALDVMSSLAAFPNIGAAIGLSTGWMVADESHASPDAAGEISRRATDLAAASPDGAIRVTPELIASLDGYFVFGDTDDTSIHLLGRTGASHRLETGAELTPLVGRRDEIRDLLRRWESACHGQPQIVLIRGDAGMGKSRLLETAMGRIAQAGDVVRAMRCQPEGAQTPYSPLVDFLRRRYGDDPARDTATRLAALEGALRAEQPPLIDGLPAIAALLHLPSELDAVTDAGERKRRIEAMLLALLDVQCAAGPLLITLEDLHWADPSTLSLLAQVARRYAFAPDVKLLLVATSRHRDGLTDVSVVELGRLPQEDAAEMARRVAGASELPDERLIAVTEHAGGIPLFIEQLIRSGGAGTDIPHTLRDLLAARLAALGEDLPLAQRAAVVGREFDVELLARLCELEPADAEAGLLRMIHAGLLARHDRQRFGFSHALICDAAYLSLPAPQRRAIHLRLARLLQTEMPGWAAEHPEAIARHLDLAAHADAAAAWLGAGRFMAGQSAFAEALAHFRSGVEALDRVQQSRRADIEFRLRIGIGNMLVALEGYGSEESHASFAKAQALSSRISDDGDLFQLMWGLWMGGRSATGESPPLEFMEKLAQVAEGATDPAIQLHLNYAYGNNYFWMGKQALARRHFDIALRIAPQVQDVDLAGQYGEDGRITSQAFLSWSLWIQGHPSAACEAAAKAVAAARALGHAHTLGYALTMEAVLYRHLGLPDKVMAICEELYARSVANGMLLWQAAAGAMIGWARAVGGDAEGLAMIRQGLAGAQQAMLIVETTFLAFLAEGLCRFGRLDEALPVVDESIDKAILREDVYYLPEFLRLKGEIRLRLDPDEAVAEDCFTRGLALAREQGAVALELRCAMSLASLWASQGNASRAAQLLAPCCAAFDAEPPYPDIEAARALLSRIAA